MMGGCCLLLLVIVLQSVQSVPRAMKVAAIFDQNTNMRHDVMFVNAIKARPRFDHDKLANLDYSKSN